MTDERVVYLGRLVAGRFVQLARCRRGLIAKRRGVASDSAHDANYRVTSFVTTSSPGDVTGHVTRSAACRVLGDSLSFFLNLPLDARRRYCPRLLGPDFGFIQ